MKRNNIPNPPPELSAVLKVDESTALRVLGWPDTSANRSKLRSALPFTGPSAAPSYVHAEIVHYGRKGQPLPTANRSGQGVKMERQG